MTNLTTDRPVIFIVVKSFPSREPNKKTQVCEKCVMGMNFYYTKFDKRAKKRWPLNVFFHQKSGLISPLKKVLGSIIRLLVLAFSFSSSRHPYICNPFSSRFISYNKNKPFIPFSFISCLKVTLIYSTFRKDPIRFSCVPRFIFVFYGFELFVRVWFVSIVFAWVVPCFLGSVF